MVLFRTLEGKVNALHAYCAHMGAHLGVGGKVTNNGCIQCPFHGWLYDG
jgi:phenylpropionate dioxygenase-like ring-hydroxylating dioxygenase large terminal subunit